MMSHRRRFVGTHPMPVHHLPLDDLTGWLVGATAPKVPEGAVLVVDLDDVGTWDAPPIHSDLPHVVVGTTADPAAHRHPAAPACDVVVGHTGAELDAILATCAGTPLAATRFVRVLRGAAERSIADGLVAESRAYSDLQAGPEFRRWREATPRRERPADGDPVLVERDENVLRLTLQRPQVRNAFNAAMREALLDALEIAQLDPTVERVELRGEGPAFCSGGDLDEFGTFESPDAAHELRVERSVARVIAELADRVVVHLHGACAGAGIELPSFAGRVVADPDTRIWLPELALGLVPGAGGTVSITRRVGRHRTALLGLTGTPIGAAMALEWGLVDAIG